MGTLSIWHWIVAIIIIASPVMGIARGVKNASVANAILSAFLPVYGLIYFFVGMKKPA